jgi:hypothetical protein
VKGISTCPVCHEDTVSIPIDDWTHEYHERTGEVMLTAHYDYERALCTNMCVLDGVDPRDYKMLGFVQDGGY